MFVFLQSCLGIWYHHNAFNDRERDAHELKDHGWQQDAKGKCEGLVGECSSSRHFGSPFFAVDTTATQPVPYSLWRSHSRDLLPDQP